MGMLRTSLLLAGLTGLFLALGWMIGGQTGMLIALVIALGTNIFAYWNSDQMVLRMYNAQEIDRSSAPELYGLVEQLAGRAQLPMPRVYIIDQPQPNAFATGRDPQHAAVAVTTGLMRILSHQELAGVLAHELAHVRNRDTLIMTVTATLAGALRHARQFRPVLRRQPRQPDRDRHQHPGGDPRTNGGNAGTICDLAHPRVCR